MSVLDDIGRVYLARDHAGAAARLFGAVEAQRERGGTPRRPEERAGIESALAAIRGEPDLVAAWEAGAAQDWQTIVEETLHTLSGS